MLASSTYTWYLQMDLIYGGFNADFAFEQAGPNVLGPVALATITMVAALLMRVNHVQRS